MKSNISWILPSIIEGFTTRKDKTISIKVSTNELTPEQQTALFGTLNCAGFLAFNEDAFKTREIEILDGLEADYNDTTLSPSKRLRNVFWVHWDKNNEGYKDFGKYYDFKMEQLISHYKTLIDDN